MPRAWGWFPDPRSVLSIVESQRAGSRISCLFPAPELEPPQEIVVVGPISQEMSCYPFLDLIHHIRRLGVGVRMAQHYNNVLRHGGLVVCLDLIDADPKEYLATFEARDVVV